MPGTRTMNLAERTAHTATRSLRTGVVMLLAFACTARAFETSRCPLADGFDYPVGKPDAAGYYKSRGYYPNGHLGEDWNGRGGGDSDLGDPIYAIGNGVVVHSDNVGVGWGNVVIVRHAFRDASGKIEMVDSLYGHLLERKVKLHQIVQRGQLVGTMGSNNGMYFVHLHLEVRKNLQIGMNRSQFARDYSNYYSPSQFISAHRQLPSSLQKMEIPTNTFAPYGKTLAEADLGSGGSKGLNIPVFQGNPTLPSVRLTPTASIRPPTSTAAIAARSGTASKSATATASKSGGAPKPGTSSSAGSRAAAPTSPPPARPAPTPPASAKPDEDFWTRLKSKLKQGRLTEEPGQRAGR